MKLILTLAILFSFSIFGDEQEDICSSYLTQRKCESTEAANKKCKWLNSKEICKNEDIQKAETNKENEKGLNATEDESGRPSSKRKPKLKK